MQFHGGGVRPPLVSVLASGAWTSAADLPFELFGLAALAILVVMAATSHDFWLHTLTAPVWKALHMSVYGAYAPHRRARGVRRPAERTEPGARGRSRDGRRLDRRDCTWPRRGGNDASMSSIAPTAWVDVCGVGEMPDRRARVACIAGERIAVFRHGDRLSAISNVCQHQNGPLGEGKIVNGCIVCPWHGYEYRPETGASPPPFTEQVPTFSIRVAAGRVLVDPRPHPPGTYVEPASIT